MQKLIGIITIAGLAAVCSARPVYQDWQSASKSTVSMQSSDGKDSYEVRIQDGKVTAKVNGEDVPADRVVRTKNGDHDTIEIRDESGNVVKKFDMLAGGGASGGHIQLAPMGRTGTAMTTAGPKVVRGFRATNRAPEAADADGNVAVAMAPDENPPPVMVGVTMSEPDASVLEFLKLENGVVFDRVIEDLPAAKAGIKVGDILVEVKGEKNIGQERFREILRGTKPGDTLDVKVARAGGEIHPITLTLVAFDAKVLGRVEPKAEILDDKGGWDVLSHQGTHKNWESAQKALEEAMKSLKENPNLQPESLKKSLQESLDKAMESMKEAKDSLRDVQIFSNNGQWATPQGTTKLRSVPGQRYMVVPSAPAVPAVPDVDDERIQSLEKKVDELNKKLDKLVKMLEDRK